MKLKKINERSKKKSPPKNEFDLILIGTRDAHYTRSSQLTTYNSLISPTANGAVDNLLGFLIPVGFLL